MKRIVLLFLAVAVAVAVVACSRTPEPTPDPTPAVPATVSSAAAKPKSDDTEVAWEAPSSWQPMPNPNPMRKATYKIGDDTELTVSTASGGVEANVKRWADQFGGAEPKSSIKKVNGLDVTVVELEGPYQGMGGTKKVGQMLLGAVVESGQILWFFKMTGPEKTVKGARPDFEKLVSSLRTKS
jgi:hypothetical protein